MSLPETIWFCEKHDALSPSKNGPCHQAHVMAYRAGGNPFESNRCRKHMVEVELHPVGSRVAGPDLVIRREVVEAWLRMANNSEIFDLEYHLEQALAAAEGEGE